MTAKEKIVKAKVNLILNHPFYATIALKLDYIESKSIDTACTNGKYIMYNPDFIDKLDLDECVFLMAHEIMHVAYLHHTRRQGRNPRKWNIATDYAINEMLVKHGFKMIEGGLLNQAYYQKSSEEIYSLLPNNPDGGSQDPGGCGGVTDADSMTKSELDQLEAETKQLLAQALQNAKRQGKLSENIDRLITRILQPKINWKEALAAFLINGERSDYSFKKPNSRYIYSGFYLPTLIPEQNELGEICLFVDTSGSIDDEKINQFAAEMQEIVNTFGKGFSVVYIDSEVKGEEYVGEDDVIKLNPKGGGGTDFIPGFEYLEEQKRKPTCVIYLTDGFCTSFPNPPDYPVLWVLIEETDYFQPTFGETIIMN